MKNNIISIQSLRQFNNNLTCNRPNWIVKYISYPPPPFNSCGGSKPYIEQFWFVFGSGLDAIWGKPTLTDVQALFIENSFAFTI